jgi:hypothetical protein
MSHLRESIWINNQVGGGYNLVYSFALDDINNRQKLSPPLYFIERKQTDVAATLRRRPPPPHC